MTYHLQRRIKKPLLDDEQLGNVRRAVFRVLDRWPTLIMEQMRFRARVRRSRKTYMPGFVYAPYVMMYVTPQVRDYATPQDREFARRFDMRFAECEIDTALYGLVGHRGEVFHAGF